VRWARVFFDLRLPRLGPAVVRTAQPRGARREAGLNRRLCRDRHRRRYADNGTMPIVEKPDAAAERSRGSDSA